MALRLASRSAGDFPLSLKKIHGVGVELQLGSKLQPEEKAFRFGVSRRARVQQLRQECSLPPASFASAESAIGNSVSVCPCVLSCNVLTTRRFGRRVCGPTSRRWKVDVATLPPWRRWAEPLIPLPILDKESKSADASPHPSFSALRDVISVANASFAFKVQKAFRCEAGVGFGIKGQASCSVLHSSESDRSGELPLLGTLPLPSSSEATDANLCVSSEGEFLHLAFVRLADLPSVWREGEDAQFELANRLPTFRTLLAVASRVSPINKECLCKTVVNACIEYLLDVFPAGILATRVPPQLLIHLDQQLRTQGGDGTEAALSLFRPQSVFNYLVSEASVLLEEETTRFVDAEQATQLLLALSKTCEGLCSFESQLRPPHVKFHWVQEQKRQFAQTLRQPNNKRFLNRLFARSVEKAEDGSVESLPCSVNADTVVPLLEASWRLGLRGTRIKELLLKAVASEAVQIEVPGLLRLLRLMVRFERPLETRVLSAETQKPHSDSLDSEVCFSILDFVGTRLQREAYAFGEEQVADICRSLVAFKVKYETAKERSRKEQVRALLKGNSEIQTKKICLPAFNETFDLWRTPLGKGLIGQLQRNLHEYQYFNLLDAGELLYEFAPPDRPLCSILHTAQGVAVPAPWMYSGEAKDLRFLNHPLSEEVERRRPMHPVTGESEEIVKILQQRVANETWKFVPAMKFGYSGKALKLFDLMGIDDRRLFRALLRHLPKMFHFRFGANFIASVFNAAATAALAYRLPQRRVHKGVQVASFKLFANLALYLQSPCLQLSPQGLSHWEGEWQRTALERVLFQTENLKGPQRTQGILKSAAPPSLLQQVTCPLVLCRLVSSVAGLGIPLNHLMHLVVLRVEKDPEMFHLEHVLSIARDLLDNPFLSERLKTQVLARQNQLPFCSPTGVATFGFVLGCMRIRDAEALKMLLRTATQSYTLLPAAAYDKVDEDWARAFRAAERVVSNSDLADSSFPTEFEAPLALPSKVDSNSERARPSQLRIKTGDDRSALEADVAQTLRATAAGERRTAEALQEVLKLAAREEAGVSMLEVKGSLHFTGVPETLFLLLGLVRLRCSSVSVFKAASKLLSEQRTLELESGHLPLLAVAVSNLFVKDIVALDAFEFSEALGVSVLQNLHRFADAEIPALIWGCASVMHATDLLKAEEFVREELEAGSVGCKEKNGALKRVPSFVEQRSCRAVEALESLMMKLVGSARCLDAKHVHLLQVRLKDKRGETFSTWQISLARHLRCGSQVLAAGFRLLSTSPGGALLNITNHTNPGVSEHGVGSASTPFYAELSSSFASFFNFVDSFPVAHSESALGLGGLRLEEQRILRLLRKHPYQRLTGSPEYDYAIHDPLRQTDPFTLRLDEETELTENEPSSDQVKFVAALLADGGVRLAGETFKAVLRYWMVAKSSIPFRIFKPAVTKSGLVSLYLCAA